MPVITPTTAVEVEEFNLTKINYLKSTLGIQGQEAISLESNSFSILLFENMLYSCYSDTVLSDGDTITDNDSNVFTIIIYNGSTISVNEYFELKIEGSNAYILKY